ncbi:glycosyltransferase family 2 protein [uncultured Campylobacter sp.]|jgi:glycosyltransferase, family 2|uniref:glycosyltransferase family 2 protein n=1 Tax=uncultured Campylobacter sp. TaxID=218934 RepID=UPI002611B6E7|nr:glycosyltransferase family 2 protein [uncultured Campylobacter sp.]
MREVPKLAVIVPCYNEEQVLYETTKRLSVVLEDLISKNKIKKDSFILYIDDGSGDNTWNIVKYVGRQYSLVKGIRLSKNQGHQNALLAGMEYVEHKCDCLISIDADLQQDEKSMIHFTDSYVNGCDVVLGIRNDRMCDSFFKRATALGFYKLMNLMGVDIIKNHADYRLLSSKAIRMLLSFKEVNLFLRGLVLLIGLKTEYIYFDVKDRYAGKSKYTLKKMFAFAWDGITSFSVVPLRLITLIGFIVFFVSLIMGGSVLYSVIANKTVQGWASTVLPIYFMGGIQLMCLGVIGEYIGKIYKETKRRPRYFIEDIIDEKS